MTSYLVLLDLRADARSCRPVSPMSETIFHLVKSGLCVSHINLVPLTPLALPFVGYRVLLCMWDWPGTFYIVQAGITLNTFFASASPMLGLQAYITIDIISSIFFFFFLVTSSSSLLSSLFYICLFLFHILLSSVLKGCLLCPSL